MLTLELASIVLEIPNAAYTTLSRNPIGCSALSQELCKLIGWCLKIMRGQLWTLTWPICSHVAYIYRSAIRSCRPGGVIVYSTCTLTPGQNDYVIEAAFTQLRQLHPDIEIMVQDTSCIRDRLIHVFKFWPGSRYVVIITKENGEVTTMLRISRCFWTFAVST